MESSSDELSNEPSLNVLGQIMPELGPNELLTDRPSSGITVLRKCLFLLNSMFSVIATKITNHEFFKFYVFYSIYLIFECRKGKFGTPGNQEMIFKILSNFALIMQISCICHVITYDICIFMRKHEKSNFQRIIL